MRLPPLLLYIYHPIFRTLSFPPFGRVRVGSYFLPLARVGCPLGGSGCFFYFMSRYGILSISP